METKTFNPNKFLHVSESAEEHLVDQINKNNAIGVELGIMPNGCAGFEFTWDYVNEYLSQEYEVIDIKDKVLIVNSISRDFIIGSNIDLKDEGIKGKTLIVESPKATGSCGYGESVQFDI
jgi:iron-sulfur cluster assembly accessory protein